MEVSSLCTQIVHSGWALSVPHLFSEYHKFGPSLHILARPPRSEIPYSFICLSKSSLRIKLIAFLAALLIGSAG